MCLYTSHVWSVCCLASEQAEAVQPVQRLKVPVIRKYQHLRLGEMFALGGIVAMVMCPQSKALSDN